MGGTKLIIFAFCLSIVWAQHGKGPSQHGPPSPPHSPPPLPPSPPPPPPPKSCSNVKCAPGLHCEMVGPGRSPKCVENRPPPPPPPPPPTPMHPPPPPPPPTPRPQQATCANVRCPGGTRCVMVTEQCLRPPCPAPAPQCISNDPPKPPTRPPPPPPPPPPPRCPSNESWTNCSSMCEPTCENRTPKCTKNCGPPKCQCDANHYRNKAGRCVRASECPRW